MEREIMDGCFSTDSPEEAGISADTSVPSPRSFGSGGDLKAAHQFSSASCSSPKRSRRSVQKKVVTIPIAEADGSRPRISGEGAPPSDSWAWRKYGQKPIKGSPYPRGYYRCSSSKGCPARKQVERSSIDPTMLVVTYSSDHDHSWPLPKPHHRSAVINISVPSPSPSLEEEEAITVVAPTPEPADEKFSDIPTIGMRDEYFWLSDVASPSAASTESTDDLLLGSIFVSAEVAAMSFGGECEELERGEEGEEEDSLFAGLGELPEWSVVFRRGVLDGRRCGLAASL